MEGFEMMLIYHLLGDVRATRYNYKTTLRYIQRHKLSRHYNMCLTMKGENRMIVKIMNDFLEKLIICLCKLKEASSLGSLILILLGSLIMSIGLSAFLLNINHNLVIGLGGLSRAIEELFNSGEVPHLLNVDISFILYWALSFITFIIGCLKKTDTEGFVLKSLIAFSLVALVFLPIFRTFGFDTFMLPLPDGISWIMQPVSAIIGGFLLALGVGLIIIGGGSTCGPDLYAVIISEKIQKRHGAIAASRAMKRTMRCLDIIVMIVGALVFRPDNVLLYFVSLSLTIFVLSCVVVSIERISKTYLQSKTVSIDNDICTKIIITPQIKQTNHTSQHLSKIAPNTIGLSSNNAVKLCCSRAYDKPCRIIAVLNEKSIFRYSQDSTI